MRQSFQAEILRVGNKMVGVMTGFDFCAEHEWGIAGLSRALGHRLNLNGVDRRIVQNAEYVNINLYEPKGREREHVAILTFGYISKDEDGFDAKKYWQSHGAYTSSPNGDMYVEWDEDDCLIAVQGQEQVELLKRLYDSALRGTLFFGTAGRGKGGFNSAFSIGQSLCAIDVADIPEPIKKAFLELDENKEALKKASEATGIVERLKKTQNNKALRYPTAGCRWYALSPRWLSEKEKAANITKHPIVFWLNPCDQDLLNYGWYTVEDLDKWIEGKGPIPKNPKS